MTSRNRFPLGGEENFVFTRWLEETESIIDVNEYAVDELQEKCQLQQAKCPFLGGRI